MGSIWKSSVWTLTCYKLKSKLDVGRSILLTLTHLHLFAPKTKWEFRDKQHVGTNHQFGSQWIALEISETNFTSDLCDWTDNTTIELTTHVCLAMELDCTGKRVSCPPTFHPTWCTCESVGFTLWPTQLLNSAACGRFWTTLSLVYA
jgi:hypothetical protein